VGDRARGRAAEARAAVWILLALAGLLRPEAWLLAGAYGVWLGWTGRCARGSAHSRPALTAPLIWALCDLVVMGDPMFSLRHTDALAAELHREVPLTHLPSMLVQLLVALVKPPVLAAGLAGAWLADALPAPRAGGSSAVAVLTCFTYLIIASGGLATVYRYLLLTALGVSLLAAFALSGWTLLPAGHRWRVRWAALAAAACVLGAAWTIAHLTLAGIRNDLHERRAVRADLRAVLSDPAVRAARACGPITVPNHKLIPEVRWMLDLPESAVRARSDRTLGPQRSGVALVIAKTIEERPALNVYEVPTDGTGSSPRRRASIAWRGTGALPPGAGAAPDVRHRGDPQPRRRHPTGPGRVWRHGCCAGAPRARRGRRAERRPLGPGDPAAGDRRPGRRPSAAGVRGRGGPPRLQWRDLQRPRAASRPRAPRAPVRLPQRRRGHRPSLRGTRPRLPRRAARHVRARALGCSRAPARARA
jgi:hypothetical protein